MRLHYELVGGRPVGKPRICPYASDEELGPGDVVRCAGRDWLVYATEPAEGAVVARLLSKPARYRLRLRHADGHEELGAFRRYRPGGPRLGHALTTSEIGHPIGWRVDDEQLAFDDDGEPFLDLVAERDYSEFEEPPDHELEHALRARLARVPDEAVAVLTRAQATGQAAELVALEAGEEPDWEAAARFVDALILEELEDDLIEQCGVDPDRDPRETWLATVKERLNADLERFRADIEGDHDEIEEWVYIDGRILASVGTFEDESDPGRGHGWMCRLLDSSALGAAGFDRVRKPQLLV